jgi:hypothetical protein
MPRPRGPPRAVSIITTINHRRTMDTHQMFVITKSGLTIRPEGVELSLAHTRHFISYLSGLLAEFQEEAARARTIAPEGIPQEDGIVADTKRELSRAEAHKANLEETKAHITRVYDRNFQDWAEAFRQARIQLGLARIEDSPHLEALLRIVMAILKAENHWFSESKFRSYINRDTEEPIITREVRRLSATA